MSLVLLLQGRGGMTAAELARELEVSERTVHRDVLALSSAGIPVYADRGRGGGYRLLEGYRTRLTGLDRAEAEALFLSGVPGALREMGLQEVAATARLKAAAALSPGLRDAPATAAQRFHLDAPGWFAHDSPPPPQLAPLARAVWGDRRVTAGYKGRTRTLEPYGLVLKAGAWYLAARSPSPPSPKPGPSPGPGPSSAQPQGQSAGQARFLLFRVDRFGEIAVRDDVFVRDPGFDLAAFWTEQSAAFGHSLLRTSITLRLTEAGLRMLRHVADPAALPDAVASLQPDGTVRLGVESIEIAYSQVLRFGPEAEVLEPAELREMVTRAAIRMAALYR